MAEDRVRSVYDLISREFAADVRLEEPSDNLSIGTNSLEITKNDPKRLSLVVINLSSNVVYIRPNKPATTSIGIRLAASGGSISMDWKSDLLLPSLSWHAIASGSSSVIYLTAVVLR